MSARPSRREASAERSLVLLGLLLGLLLRGLLLLLGSHRLLLFVEPTGLDEKSTSASLLGNRRDQHPARCAIALVPETLVTRAFRSERCVTHSFVRFPRTTIQVLTRLPLPVTQSGATCVAGGLNVERRKGHLFSPSVSLRAQLLFNPSAHTNASLFFVLVLRAWFRTRSSSSIMLSRALSGRALHTIARAFSRRQPIATPLALLIDARCTRATSALQTKLRAMCLTARARNQKPPFADPIAAI